MQDLYNENQKEANSTLAMNSIINLSNGTETLETTGPLNENMYINIYTIFIIVAIILTCARSALFYIVCMTASKVLHNRMFSHVLKAPMRFFDTNPSGR